MKTWRHNSLIWLIAGALLLGLVMATLLVALRPRSPIPGAISSQLNFPVFLPQSKSEYKVDTGTFEYRSQERVLLFQIKKPGVGLTTSEQATPDPFNDIPGYSDKLMEKLNGYSTFDTLNGKVTLTRPQELNGGQSAVFIGKGTLMFVRPTKDLNQDEWRVFFNDLVASAR